MGGVLGLGLVTRGFSPGFMFWETKEVDYIALLYAEENKDSRLRPVKS